jgi:polyferredoxin/NAD-dependent dihydropyrimidine dehydrogenase PreA subunit
MAKRTNRRHLLHVLRIVSQLLFLGLFVGLLVATVLGSPVTDHPWLAQVFLITDPLILVGMTLAGAFSVVLLAALAVVGLSLLFPRAYCGWICPLGTSMDAVDHVLFRKMKRNRSAAPHLRKIKYGLLAAVLVMAVFGLGVFGWLDPICIATRSFAVAVYPIADWAAKAGLVAAEERGVGAAADLYDWAAETGLFIRDANFKEGSPGIAYLWLPAFTGVLLGIWLSQAYQKRFWCRNLCPLGALMGLVGSVSPFRPRVSEKCISCDACRQGCKVGAFQPAAGGDRYRNLVQECIFCYSCEREFCPVDAIHIGAGTPGPVRPAPDVLPGRRAALTAVAAGAAIAPAMLLDRRTREKHETNPKVRPPGSLRPDTEFLAACVRCGECMRVCPTNALHPSGIENGVAGLWTPTFVFNIGYCEYYCGVSAEDVEAGRTDATANLCGQVCPTGAIRPLTHAGKIDHKIGTAVFDHTRCLPWARGEECLTCEEQCPLPEKAISHRTEEVANLDWLHLPQTDRHRYEELEAKRAAGTLSDAERQELEAMPPKSRRLARPYVLRDRCIGCGTCENVCPVDGKSGVRVERLQTRAIQ